MSTLELKPFQKYYADVIEKKLINVNSILLDAPTGSGKTFILSTVANNLLHIYNDVAIIWVTPGIAELEEQSADSIKKYFPKIIVNDLNDILLKGFIAGQCYCLNYEKFTKKTNKVLRSSGRINLNDRLREANNNGIRYIFIVDECHRGDTKKVNDIINIFNPFKTIRCSATPTQRINEYSVKIPEYEVIDSGLIKKRIVINDGINSKNAKYIDEFELIKLALSCRDVLDKKYNENKSNIIPLIVIIVSNNYDISKIEKFLKKKFVNYAVWLAEKHFNTDGIKESDSKVTVVISKEAISTGWDCPRAQILVKLRSNMDEKFEIQTIGRIRRMPEGFHYKDEMLNNCYIFTNDENFECETRKNFRNIVSDAETLKLKEEFYNISLVSEKKTGDNIKKDTQTTEEIISKYLTVKYTLGRNYDKNKKILEKNGYIFSNEVLSSLRVGEISCIHDASKLNKVVVNRKMSLNEYGNHITQALNNISTGIGITDITNMNKIVFRLFNVDTDSNNKIIKLNENDTYTFILNNYEKLEIDFNSSIYNSIVFCNSKPILKQFYFPKEYIEFFDKLPKKCQTIMKKNVYYNYKNNVIRSKPEKLFEKYCEQSENIAYYFKNGDNGDKYFSIIYIDADGTQREFYPDYIVFDSNRKIHIIEIKGNFDEYDNSENIDKKTPIKFESLKNYCEKYGYGFGIVRYYEASGQLFICNTQYNEDINDDNWKLLDDEFKEN